MTILFKLLCYAFWISFVGYLVYWGLGGHGIGSYTTRASIGFMGMGLSMFLYAIYIGKKLLKEMWL